MTPGSVVVGYLDGGHWSACFGLSYRDMLLRDQATSRRIVREGGAELRKQASTGEIVKGRNQIAADFLDTTDGEWLFMVDSDMGFAADTVDRLVASADEYDRPIMGGLCFKHHKLADGEYRAQKYFVQSTLYAWHEREDEVGFVPLMAYPRDQVFPVSATGAACILFHRSALETIRAAKGDTWFDPITHPTGKDGKPRAFSEDLSFCIRAASCDIPIHVDTSVKTCHDKGGVFLDEDEFDRQAKFLELLNGEIAEQVEEVFV